MKCLPTELKTRKVEVSGRIAIFPCQLDTSELKVYDHNGCEIKEAGVNIPCCGNVNSASSVVREIAVIDDSNKTGVDFMKVGTIIDGDNRNYVVTDFNHIELNFDTDYIEVETFEVATYYDEYYDCEVPYVYDDGLLLEALAWYCLFKYLSRGSKHPVYDLKSNSPVTNPWLQWNTLRPKAANSVKKAISADMSGWNNFFYNSTFRPRG